MKPISAKSFLVAFALFFAFACSNNEDNSEPLELSENEFTVQPEKPSKADEISVITCDCAYNQLAYIKRDGFTIELIKHFNSMMKQPCVLKLDTIKLGKLAAGTYQLKLIIVDTSTMILPADSIFHTEEQQLVVVN